MWLLLDWRILIFIGGPVHNKNWSLSYLDLLFLFIKVNFQTMLAPWGMNINLQKSFPSKFFTIFYKCTSQFKSYCWLTQFHTMMVVQTQHEAKLLLKQVLMKTWNLFVWITCISCGPCWEMFVLKTLSNSCILLILSSSNTCIWAAPCN